MSEPGSRTPASDWSAFYNIRRIQREDGETTGRDLDVSNQLRQELREKGLRGFRHGGRVHRTGIYRLHAGERVIPARGKRRGRR